MNLKKFDYSKTREDIFYKVIYPLYSREFMFGDDYTKFAELVQSNFILNSEQWEYILEHWDAKENRVTNNLKKQK